LYDADGEPVGPALPNSVAKHGPRGRQTDSGTKRAEIHQGPGLHLMPDKQAGYMTATEFQIASAIQPLHAGGVHICVAERGEFELPVPISEQSDYKKMAGFAVPRRIVGIARGSNAGSTYSVGNNFSSAGWARTLPKRPTCD
jgi:hypothetical protein